MSKRFVEAPFRCLFVKKMGLRICWICAIIFVNRISSVPFMALLLHIFLNDFTTISRVPDIHASLTQEEITSFPTFFQIFDLCSLHMRRIHSLNQNFSLSTIKWFLHSKHNFAYASQKLLRLRTILPKASPRISRVSLV